MLPCSLLVLVALSFSAGFMLLCWTMFLAEILRACGKAVHWTWSTLNLPGINPIANINFIDQNFSFSLVRIQNIMKYLPEIFALIFIMQHRQRSRFIEIYKLIGMRKYGEVGYFPITDDEIAQIRLLEVEHIIRSWSDVITLIDYIDNHRVHWASFITIGGFTCRFCIRR